MAEFQHADLIPRKYSHAFARYEEMPDPDGTHMHLLAIYHRGVNETLRVDVRCTDIDLEAPRKKFLERFIKPALYALEHRIAHG